MGDADVTETKVVLAAQLPIIVPDEVAGLLAIRDLPEEELASFRADTALVAAGAPMIHYTRVVEAVGALSELADELSASRHRHERRSIDRLHYAVVAVASAFSDLPGGFAQPDDDKSIAAASAAFLADPAPGVVAEMKTLSRGHITLLEGGALALAWPGVASLPGATALVQPGQGLLLDRLLDEAVRAAARLAARWLLARRDDLDAASHRIARLNGEVIEGTAAVMTLRLNAQGKTTSFTPEPLPMPEIAQLQFAMLQAERVMSEAPPGPATKGPVGFGHEQILALSDASAGHEGAPPAALTEPEHGETGDVQPLHARALVDHLFKGSVLLEAAWSRAVEERETATIAAEWHSALLALRAGSPPDTGSDAPPADDGLPAAETDTATWLCDPRITTQAAAARVLESIKRDAVALVQPSLRSQASGRHAGQDFFDSGAFGALRGKLELLQRLRDDAGQADERSRAAMMAADRRGDAEACIFHAARLVRSDGGQADELRTRILEAGAVLHTDADVRPGPLVVLAEAAIAELA